MGDKGAFARWVAGTSSQLSIGPAKETYAQVLEQNPPEPAFNCSDGSGGRHLEPTVLSSTTQAVEFFWSRQLHLVGAGGTINFFPSSQVTALFQSGLANQPGNCERSR